MEAIPVMYHHFPVHRGGSIYPLIGPWHESHELKLSLAVVVVEAYNFTLEGPEYLYV